MVTQLLCSRGEALQHEMLNPLASSGCDVHAKGTQGLHCCGGAMQLSTAIADCCQERIFFMRMLR